MAAGSHDPLRQARKLEHFYVNVAANVHWHIARGKPLALRLPAMDSTTARAGRSAPRHFQIPERKWLPSS